MAKINTGFRPVPQAFFSFIPTVEGCLLRVYDDKRPRVVLHPGDQVLGVLTAGYGHTGADLAIGMTVTKMLATQWLKTDSVRKAAIPLCRKIGDVADELTENQYAALLSFVYNLGTGDPKKAEWTIWKRVRARQFDQIPIEMDRFVNWNGEKSEALVNRRNAEKALWAKGEPGTKAAPLEAVEFVSSSVTHRESTEPTPLEAGPPHAAPTVVATALTFVSTVPAAVSKVTEVISPYSDHSSYVQNALGILATAGAAAAGVALLLTWLKARQAHR